MHAAKDDIQQSQKEKTWSNADNFHKYAHQPEKHDL